MATVTPHLTGEGPTLVSVDVDPQEIDSAEKSARLRTETRFITVKHRHIMHEPDQVPADLGGRAFLLSANGAHSANARSHETTIPRIT